LAVAYNWASEFKQIEIALAILSVFNRYNEENFEVGESSAIYGGCLERMANILIFQNDIKTSEENLKLLIFLSRYEPYQERLDSFNFLTILSEYAKLLVLNKNVCEDHCDLLLLYLECLFEYIIGKGDKCRAFAKMGGLKRLKSLPKQLLKNGENGKKLELIFAEIASFV